MGIFQWNVRTSPCTLYYCLYSAWQTFWNESNDWKINAAYWVSSFFFAQHINMYKHRVNLFFFAFIRGTEITERRVPPVYDILCYTSYNCALFDQQMRTADLAVVAKNHRMFKDLYSCVLCAVYTMLPRCISNDNNCKIVWTPSNYYV